ncbi:MAG: ion channel [Myxococcota bacterium]
MDLRANHRPNFRRLLGTLIFVILTGTLVTSEGVLANAFIQFVFVSSLVLVTTSISRSAPNRLAVYAVGGFALVSGLVGLVLHERTVAMTVFAAYIVFFGLVFSNVLRHVFSTSTVTADDLFAVCCVYVLAGLDWAFAYALTDLVFPGSLTGIIPDEAAFGQYVYFSLVTLTSLGYGDIAPATSLARSLASLEALFGQAFLAVFVAHVVADAGPPKFEGPDQTE